MIAAIGNVLGWLMYAVYNLIRNYGVSIVIFTLLTKIVLLPISIRVQKNSIKMVKMYPQMNYIKAKYFGNKDMISEEQYNLYKKEGYNPMLDLVPVFLQLVILMGVVDVIYKPMKHLLHVGQDSINKLIEVFCNISGMNPEVGSIQINIVDNLLQSEYMSQFQSVVSADVFQKIGTIDFNFLGINLGAVPAQTWGITILVPILAALSAWFMCAMQNKINVLQAEQGKANQWTTLLISVGLSLYLGFFVPAGVGLYWICGNLLSVVQLVLLNMWINPKDYIDYEELEKSKQELNKMVQFTKENNNKEYADLEKQDYKRFMKYGEKQIVFYSEKNGFYKYFQNIIEVILRKTDIVIHYITNDPKDEVFKLANDNFRVYYIGENKLIVLMMKLETDIMVMTTPDLQRYHLKRSLVKDDIEYIYIDHAIGSSNLTLRKHALDYFDTIFATNITCEPEIREMEKLYSTKQKNIVEWGYGLLDNMIENYEKNISAEKKADEKTILIAPSWQEDNILDLCIRDLLNGLLGKGYKVIVRPHPQYLRHCEVKLDILANEYKDAADFEIQKDFSSNSTVYNADILISDWSGIAYEYSLCTLKPTLFINTPMKVMNPDYQEISVTPFDIETRNKIGIALEVNELDKVGATVEKLLNDVSFSKEEMKKVREHYIYNIGRSGEVGADYIIKQLIKYSGR